MSLKLYYHPLSSFCHKALIALYEGGIPFEPVFVNLADEASSAALRALWPIAKFPVLRDEARGQTVAEATVIIEYLDTHYGTRLVPARPRSGLAGEDVGPLLRSPSSRPDAEVRRRCLASRRRERPLRRRAGQRR